MRAARWIALLCVTFAQAAGAEITDLQVERKGKRYDIRFEVLIAAPPGRVLQLFSEPARWTELSKVIKRAERLEADRPGRKAPVSIVFQACVLFLCREADKVSVLDIDVSAGTVTGRSVPGRGDFRYASERWRITPHAAGTRIVFAGILEPAFAVPSLIGPHVLRSMLRKMLVEMEDRLENPPAD